MTPTTSGSPSAAARSLRLLAGLRVLELGDGVAGAVGTSLLATLGAEVTAVVDPARPHRSSGPGVTARGRRTSMLSAVLDRGKRLVSAADGLGSIERLIASDDSDDHGGFDVIVADRVGVLPTALVALTDIDDYLAFVEATNRNAWVTISAFGLSGDRRSDIADELAVSAAAGLLASVRDVGTRRPLQLAGSQGLLSAGHAAALAACHALSMAMVGSPCHLDLSAVEATIATGPSTTTGAFMLAAAGPGGAKRYGAPSGFLPCSDGLVRISAMEDHQWRGVVTTIGAPPWTERFMSPTARMDGRDEVDALLAQWSRNVTKLEAETLLQANGVPATALRSPAEILAMPQLRHRRAFIDVQLPDGQSAEVVATPFGVVVAESAGELPRRRGLSNLNVVEVGHVLAAPLAGALLGALGANVTKIEDTRRLDMYRRRGPYIDDVPGPERSPYFALVNHSKASVAFDLESSPDRVEEVLGSADVVVENVGGRRADRLRLLATDLVARHPHVLTVNCSGFGHEGPFAAYRAYAYNIHSACGLAYLTRNSDGECAEIDLAWADLISGYALATVIAAWAVGPKGNVGTGIDFAMSDLVATRFNEFIAAASLPSSSTDRNDATPTSDVSGVYPARDRWITLAAQTDEQFAQLVRLLDHAPLDDPDFETAVGRVAHRDRLVGLLADATSTRDAAELAATLRRSGLIAENVMTPRELPHVPHLVSRGFLTPVVHPDWGERPLIGIPWRPIGAGPIPLGAPPMLGADGCPSGRRLGQTRCS